jgi:flavin reductase (DIM6/NTAB) family NADH-FMN oxidoreductase RutF
MEILPKGMQNILNSNKILWHMTKKKIGPSSILFPMPSTIIGANVNGKPNFLTVAYCGIIEAKPPLIMISLGKSHFTNDGIKENKTFSVNIPSADMVEATDYVGIYSGKDTDKSKIFGVFYGELKTAPMIEEAPLNLECKLVNNVDLSIKHDVFIGEIVQTHVKEECLTNGVPDIRKVDPIIYATKIQSYVRVGDVIGKAWKIGKNFKN